MAEKKSVDKVDVTLLDDDCPAPPVPDGVLINEIQLLLAEKRTYLAFLRTGIAILALPLSLISFLIATSQHYRVIQVWPLLAPLLGACVALAVFGILMIRSAVQKIRHAENLIRKLKQKSSVIAEFIQ
ncbi:MAG: DUF202 domain-containing protein [Desulfosoma sp.]